MLCAVHVSARTLCDIATWHSRYDAHGCVLWSLLAGQLSFKGCSQQPASLALILPSIYPRCIPTLIANEQTSLQDGLHYVQGKLEGVRPVSCDDGAAPTAANTAATTGADATPAAGTPTEGPTTAAATAAPTARAETEETPAADAPASNQGGQGQGDGPPQGGAAGEMGPQAGSGAGTNFENPHAFDDLMVSEGEGGRGGC